MLAEMLCVDVASVSMEPAGMLLHGVMLHSVMLHSVLLQGAWVHQSLHLAVVECLGELVAIFVF